MGEASTGRGVWCAALLAAALAAGGCSASDGAAPVAGEAAPIVSVPAPPGTAAPSTGPVDPRLLACLTRNDRVDPEGRHKDWSNRHKRAAYDVMDAAQGKLGVDPSDQVGAVTRGYLAERLDTGTARVIVLVDPALVDLAVFRPWLEEEARKANSVERVRGEKVGVSVQEACFSAAEIGRVWTAVMARRGWSSAQIGLDSRIHATYCGEDAAEVDRMARRYAPVLVGHRLCVRPA